ncbi:hypothetical protein D3C81_677950 [compost metagenome]
MAGAVEFARLAEGVQLLGRTFDAAAFLADQVQLTAGQTRSQGVEQVIGQVAGLGQKQDGGVEGLGWRFYAEVAAPGEACIERRLIAGMPAPAMGRGQFAEQVVGRQTGQQQRALEKIGLTKQHFTARVHGRRLLKKVAQFTRAWPGLDLAARAAGEKRLGVFAQLLNDTLP